MGDQFDKYIQKNRDLFDDEVPGEGLWQDIDKRLTSSKTRDYRWLWKVAALALFVLSTGLLIDRYSNETVAENEFNQEFQQAESFYTSLIQQKRNEILAYDKSTLSEEFLTEIDKLDSMYVQLKKTFRKEVADEKVVNAMINNLQLRIEILNQQLLIIKNLKKQQNENENIQEI